MVYFKDRKSQMKNSDNKITKEFRKFEERYNFDILLYFSYKCNESN